MVIAVAMASSPVMSQSNYNRWSDPDADTKPVAAKKSTNAEIAQFVPNQWTPLIGSISRRGFIQGIRGKRYGGTSNARKRTCFATDSEMRAFAYAMPRGMASQSPGSPAVGGCRTGHLRWRRIARLLSVHGRSLLPRR